MVTMCQTPKRRLIEWWGPVIREYYGGMETSVVAGAHAVLVARTTSEIDKVAASNRRDGSMAETIVRHY